MSSEQIFAGLNLEQRRAVEAVRGPVCILAGAGSGKTTTITRRIANQVATGAFPPGAILAVTFTDKAAGEMKARLGALGVGGVQARTFHSAALAQLRALAVEPPGEVLPSKVLLLRQIAGGLPGAYRFRSAADLATEVEWAKNRRIAPERYLDELGSRSPPIPPDLMLRVYREYERRKQALGRVDFEDLLELAIRMYECDERALGRFQTRYQAFTVDEYQDVNLLQQTLLERWLGARRELCAVGDDYQSIYAFTGASPEALLAMPLRFPDATVVKLEANYRSSPEVLTFANRLVPALGGVEKVLRPTQPAGPEPVARGFASRDEEGAFVVERIRTLNGEEDVPLAEVALFYRTNARSEDYEQLLHAAGIPFRVRGGAFLMRAAARRLLRPLESSGSTQVAAEVQRAAEEAGMLVRVPDGLGENERTRQADLARLVELARAFDDGNRAGAEFVAELRARFADGDGDGVNLLTFHRAKGLEFEAVFLPRLEERELPCRGTEAPEQVAEERRLLYVGITRAKRHLCVTWAGKPSRFLAELGVSARRKPVKRDASELPPAYGALREWRRRRAADDGVPAYVVFHDRTLVEIATSVPRTRLELSEIAGIGPAKLERYGEDLLRVLETGERDDGSPAVRPARGALAEPGGARQR